MNNDLFQWLEVNRPDSGEQWVMYNNHVPTSLVIRSDFDRWNLCVDGETRVLFSSWSLEDVKNLGEYVSVHSTWRYDRSFDHLIECFDDLFYTWSDRRFRLYRRLYEVSVRNAENARLMVEKRREDMDRFTMVRDEKA